MAQRRGPQRARFWHDGVERFTAAIQALTASAGFTRSCFCHSTAAIENAEPPNRPNQKQKCHPERTEAPAERSRKPALSLPKGTCFSVAPAHNPKRRNQKQKCHPERSEGPLAA